MLHSVARNAAMPIPTPSPRSGCHDAPPPGQKEPGRVSPADMAAEANFANPLGAAQATMAKITAAQTKQEPNPPTLPPQAAMPAAPGDLGIKAHMIMAAQPAITAQRPQAFAPAAPHGNPLGAPRGTPRGAECNLQA